MQALDAFAEGTYLHQVVERSPAGVTRYVDLPEAIAAARTTAVDSGEWRVHFHVRFFLAAMQQFGTTQPQLAATIAAPEAPCELARTSKSKLHVGSAAARSTGPVIVCTAIRA
jgi:hypothetical protein